MKNSVKRCLLIKWNQNAILKFDTSEENEGILENMDVQVFRGQEVHQVHQVLPEYLDYKAIKVHPVHQAEKEDVV
jgi:hypothetical protein